jgi:hypothetical protein
MRHQVTALACLAALTAGTEALADCVSEATSVEVKRAFAQGEAHEKAGRDREAVFQYFAAQEYTCDAPNTRSAEAAKRAAPLALRAGRAAETKGDLAEAFRLYEAGGHYAAADEALAAQVRAKPDDLTLWEKAREHFSYRDLPAHAANNKERIAAAGPYTLDRTLHDFVMRHPAQGVERALQREATLFSDAYVRDYEAMMRERHTLPANDMSSYTKVQATQQGFNSRWPEDRLKQSRDALATARDWGHRWLPPDAASKAAMQKIDARAVQRGDVLAQKFPGAPEVLEEAMRYYRFAQQDPKVAAVKTQAGQLGAKAEAQGALRLASKYYDAADDDKRADAAQARADAQAQAAMQPTLDAMQKQVAEIQKGYSDPAKVEEMKRRAREQQEQLRKQQAGAKDKNAKSAEELEKELGM